MTSHDPFSVLKRIPYPVTVVMTNYRGVRYGQAAVWVTQVSYDPVRFHVALGHTRNTSDKIRHNSYLSISWVANSADAAHFGRQSGRDVDKFADGCPPIFNFHPEPMVTVPALLRSSIAVAGHVSELQDAGSHLVFTVDVTDIVHQPEYSFLPYDYGSI